MAFSRADSQGALTLRLSPFRLPIRPALIARAAGIGAVLALRHVAVAVLRVHLEISQAGSRS